MRDWIKFPSVKKKCIESKLSKGNSVDKAVKTCSDLVSKYLLGMDAILNLNKYI